MAILVGELHLNQATRNIQPSAEVWSIHENYPNILQSLSYNISLGPLLDHTLDTAHQLEGPAVFTHTPK